MANKISNPDSSQEAYTNWARSVAPAIAAKAKKKADFIANFEKDIESFQLNLKDVLITQALVECKEGDISKEQIKDFMEKIRVQAKLGKDGNIEINLVGAYSTHRDGRFNDSEVMYPIVRHLKCFDQTDYSTEDFDSMESSGSGRVKLNMYSGPLHDLPAFIYEYFDQEVLNVAAKTTEAILQKIEKNKAILCGERNPDIGRSTLSK